MVIILPLKYIFWELERLIPRSKTKWVFGAWFGDRYSDNSRAIFEYVVSNRKEIEPLWLTRNENVYDELVSKGLPVAKLGSWKAAWFTLRASIAFITVELKEVNGFFLNGAKQIWLWHGMPLKKIQADEQEFVNNGRKTIGIYSKLIRLLTPYSRYSPVAVISLSEFFNPFMSSAFRVDNSIVWTEGYPRNDAFFSKNREPIITQYRKKFPNATFIICMPTHRLHGLNGLPYSPFIGNGFNQMIFEETLEKSDYVFFYKGHFYDKEAKVEIQSERFVTVTDRDFDNLYTFVKDMDVLITDYSSIYFDYLLLNKPIILTPFDLNQYLTTERPIYFSYEKLGAIKAYNWTDLMDILENRKFYKPTEKESELFVKHRDGNSSQRIVNRIEHQLL